jgi:RND superfamily putative drug exporter
MLVRLVLIPTLLRVFGHHAWALPRWLDRLLPDVRFGHAG